MRQKVIGIGEDYKRMLHVTKSLQHVIDRASPTTLIVQTTLKAKFENPAKRVNVKTQTLSRMHSTQRRTT